MNRIALALLVPFAFLTLASCTDFSSVDSRGSVVGAEAKRQIAALPERNGRPDRFAIVMAGPKLKHGDVPGFGTTLAEKTLLGIGFPREHVISLGVHGGAATIADFDAAIDGLAAVVDEHDVVLVNFSGHGRDGVVYLGDGRLSGVAFRSRLARIRPKLGVAVMNSCGIGSFRDDPPDRWMIIVSTTTDVELNQPGGLERWFFGELKNDPRRSVQTIFECAKETFMPSLQDWHRRGPQMEGAAALRRMSLVD